MTTMMMTMMMCVLCQNECSRLEAHTQRQQAAATRARSAGRGAAGCARAHAASRAATHACATRCAMRQPTPARCCVDPQRRAPHGARRARRRTRACVAGGAHHGASGVNKRTPPRRGAPAAHRNPLRHEPRAARAPPLPAAGMLSRALRVPQRRGEGGAASSTHCSEGPQQIPSCVLLQPRGAAQRQRAAAAGCAHARPPTRRRSAGRQHLSGGGGCSGARCVSGTQGGSASEQARRSQQPAASAAARRTGETMHACFTWRAPAPRSQSYSQPAGAYAPRTATLENERPCAHALHRPGARATRRSGSRGARSHAAHGPSCGAVSACVQAATRRHVNALAGPRRRSAAHTARRCSAAQRAPTRRASTRRASGRA
jgi:hypothetical protein